MRRVLRVLISLGVVVLGLNAGTPAFAFSASAAPAKTLASVLAATSGSTLPSTAPALSAAISASGSYTITDLGPGDVYGINASGQVVGESYFAGGGGGSVIWDAGATTMRFLESGGAYGINNAGDAVGAYIPGDGNVWPAIWPAGSTTPQLLPHPDITYGQATAINDSGQVAGLVNNQAFLYDAYDGGYVYDGAYVILTPDSATPYAINQSGTVVGVDYELLGFFPTTWQADGPHRLPLPAGGTGWAHDINDAGKSVGFINQSSPGGVTSSDAALWDGVGYYILANPAAIGSSAGAINNRDQILGAYSDSSGVLHHALYNVLWENGTYTNTYTDLDTLLPPDSGWSNLNGKDINDASQIAGVGLIKGEYHAFRLTPHRPWTLMFYLDGDNNLPIDGIFNGLEEAADNPNVTVLALWDGPGSGDSFGFKVKHDADPDHLASYTLGVDKWELGEVDMGSPSTLAGFLQWGMTTYPADHYAAILHGHGSGLGGALPDDTSGNYMSVPGIDSALRAATADPQINHKIDVLFMFSCLMGMVEDAYQFMDSIDHYVASENAMWSYPENLGLSVAGIGAASDPAFVARLFARNYFAVVESNFRDYTISVADIAQLGPVVNATNQLAADLAAKLSDDYPATSLTLSQVQSDVQRFDNKPPPNHIGPEDTYADLYHFAQLVQADTSDTVLRDSAQAVMEAVTSYIVFERHSGLGARDLSDSHGVSIFFPATRSSFYNSLNYDFVAGADWTVPEPPAPAARGTAAAAAAQLATTWGGMLASYFQATQPNGPDDPTPPDLVPLQVPGAAYAPAITAQPADQTVNTGDTATFTAAADGSPAPTVQWQVSTDGGGSFADVPGATSATYTFTALPGDSGHQFRAVFTNPPGTATSNAATLTVNTPPVVTTQPANQTVNAGGTASFTAAASGNPAPTVQWQVSIDGGATFANIAGATSASYSFAAQLAAGGNQYRAVFTNPAGTATTNAATLTVNAVPVITLAPVSQTVNPGGTATFVAAASGSPAPTVQWQVSTNNGASFSNIAGATTGTYAFVAQAADSGRQYRAVFTNGLGSATTSAAALTVASGGAYAAGAGFVNDPSGVAGLFAFSARNVTGQAQGQLAYLYRGRYAGRAALFVIRSNAVTALSMSGVTYPVGATLAGPATIRVVRADNGAVLFTDSHATFSATAVDAGTAFGFGKDKFGLAVLSGNGQPYKTVPASLLQFGNVTVRLK